jgi:hypothetical protein
MKTPKPTFKDLIRRHYTNNGWFDELGNWECLKHKRKGHNSRMGGIGCRKCKAETYAEYQGTSMDPKLAISINRNPFFNGLCAHPFTEITTEGKVICAECKQPCVEFNDYTEMIFDVKDIEGKYELRNMEDVVLKPEEVEELQSLIEKDKQQAVEEFAEKIKEKQWSINGHIVVCVSDINDALEFK